MTPLEALPYWEMHCGGRALRKHNATPREDGNLRIGVPTTRIVDEGIDSIWWG